jgi:hypothetical protein
VSIFNQHSDDACSFCLTTPTHRVDATTTRLKASVTQADGEVWKVAGSY